MKARIVMLIAVALLGSAAVGAALAAPTAPSPAAGSSRPWVPPVTSSKQPDAAEWENGAPLDLPRKHCSDAMADGSCRSTCSAKVLREWVRVSCKRAKDAEVLMGIRVLAGPADDVTLIDPPASASGEKGQRGMSLVFPMRRGERRTIEIAAMLPLMWKAWTVEEELELVVSAMWLANAERPVVTVY